MMVFPHKIDLFGRILSRYILYCYNTTSKNEWEVAVKLRSYYGKTILSGTKILHITSLVGIYFVVTLHRNVY